MKNILVITLGEHDVQINSGIHNLINRNQVSWEKIGPDIENKLPYPIQDGDNLLTIIANEQYIVLQRERDNRFPIKYNRCAATVLSENYSLLSDYLDLPIITPVLCELESKLTGALHEIWFIVTDQGPEVGDYRYRDTCDLPGIIEKKIKEFGFQKLNLSSCVFKTIKITTNVTNLGVLYNTISKVIIKSIDYCLEQICDPKFSNYYLAIQGGIDAINMATLLKFTEWRPDSWQFQIKENGEIYLNNFPEKIQKNIVRRIVLGYAEKKYFDAIQQMEHSPRPLRLVAETIMHSIHFNWEWFDGVNGRETSWSRHKLKILKPDDLLGYEFMYNDFKSFVGLIDCISENKLDKRVSLFLIVIEWYLEQQRYSDALIRIDMLKEYIFSFIQQKIIEENNLRDFSYRRINKKILINKLNGSDSNKDSNNGPKGFKKFVADKLNTNTEVNPCFVDLLNELVQSTIVQFFQNECKSVNDEVIVEYLIQKLEFNVEDVRQCSLNESGTDFELTNEKVKVILVSFIKDKIFPPQRSIRIKDFYDKFDGLEVYTKNQLKDKPINQFYNDTQKVVLHYLLNKKLLCASYFTPFIELHDDIGAKFKYSRNQLTHHGSFEKFPTVIQKMKCFIDEFQSLFPIADDHLLEVGKNLMKRYINKI